MANEQNLKPVQSESEAREKGRKGGIASGESRRKRKTLKEELLAILSDGDIQKRISTALINEALVGNSAGSVTRAFEAVRDTIGEKPVEKVMVSEVDPDIISEIESGILDDDNTSTGN